MTDISSHDAHGAARPHVAAAVLEAEAVLALLYPEVVVVAPLGGLAQGDAVHVAGG